MKQEAHTSPPTNPAAASPYRRAPASPLALSWPGWKSALLRAFRDLITDRASLVAAGCAFYGTLALFPALSILISLYGLAFDPKSVEPHLQVLRELLPASAFALIAERVHLLATSTSRLLGINLVVSTAVTVWSATTGTKSLIGAINHAYDVWEERSILRYQAIAFGLTILAMLGAALGLAALVALPAAMPVVAVSPDGKLLIQAISFALTLAFVLLALSIVYRYGPCRARAGWRWVMPGSILATALWVGASMLFSLYVSDFAPYDAMYGSLGAVAGILMWFFVSAYSVLLGAELNAELERAARDGARE